MPPATSYCYISDRIRRRVALLVCLLGVGAARADDSLARVVPADVGLFIELRHADDLLVPLIEPEIWLTVAELAGQPAALPETEEWQRRVRRTVGMSPADAIRTLFSQRVAFVAASLRETRDAVVLCRLRATRRELVSRWQARPLPAAGRTAVYRLPYDVGLAISNDVFMFGDRATGGLFDHMLECLERADGGGLADRPEYRRLLGRVPPDPDGVVFARMRPLPPTATTSAPSPGRRPARRAPMPWWPRIMRHSDNVLLALHRDRQLLHLSAVGDARGEPPTRDSSLNKLVESLPDRTLVAWAGHVDYARLAKMAADLPERNVFRVTYQLHEQDGTIQSLTAALSSATCVAVGAVTPTARQVQAPPIPAFALLVSTRDPGVAAEEWANLFEHTIALYNLLSLKLATPPALPPIKTLRVAEIGVQQLDLGGLLVPAPELTPLGELHLSWARDDDVLIIASHTDWLRQIVEARHGRGKRLAKVLGLSRRPTGGQEDTILIAQSGPLADLGRLWLDYFERTFPFVLSERWWRNYQPGGTHVRLGVQVTEDQQRHRLRVLSTTPGGPADGVLKVGDEIVGCNRLRFATSRPVREMRRGIHQRPNARWIDLLVERDRVVLVKRVPLPFVDPIEVLRRIIAVGHILQRAVYIDDAPDAEGSRGYLTLELRQGRPPLFDFQRAETATMSASPPSSDNPPDR